MLQAVRILAVASVFRTPRGLDIGSPPRLRSERTQECGRMECSGPHFHIIGLQNDAAPVSPVPLQREYEILEVQGMAFFLMFA